MTTLIKPGPYELQDLPTTSTDSYPAMSVEPVVSVKDLEDGGTDASTRAIQRLGLLDAMWGRDVDLSTVHDLARRIALIEKLYAQRDAARVSGLLRGNPALIDLLFEARFWVEKHFEPGASMVLEVVSDPEAEDLDTLVAYVQTTLGAQEAIDRLQKIDDDWFLDADDRSEGRFLLNVEFL